MFLLCAKSQTIFQSYFSPHRSTTPLVKSRHIQQVPTTVFGPSGIGSDNLPTAPNNTASFCSNNCCCPIRNVFSGNVIFFLAGGGGNRPAFALEPVAQSPLNFKNHSEAPGVYPFSLANLASHSLHSLSLLLNVDVSPPIQLASRHLLCCGCHHFIVHEGMPPKATD